MTEQIIAPALPSAAAELPLDESLQQRRFQSLLRLLEITRLLADEIDAESIMEVAVREACRALDCERASLYAFDEATNELYTQVMLGFDIEPYRTVLGRGITGTVGQTRLAEIVNDPPSDPRWSSRIDKATGFQTRNLLAAPIIDAASDRLLGVLLLLNKREGAFDDFDLQLATAYCDHTAAALHRAELVDTQRRRQLVEAALLTARDIQRGFMPTKLPEFPGYEAASWWLPNQEIGGDYCDLIKLRDGHAGLIVADVSGHGLGPSLLMASVRAALRALLLLQSSPESVLSMLGKTLHGDLQRGFITMFFGSVDFHNHTLHFANAGHAPALHYSAKRNRFRTLEATGMPLGVQDPHDYTTGPTIKIDVGDLVVLCTDGIVEAMDAGGKQFGVTRLKDLIRKNLTLPIGELAQKIGGEVQAHYQADAPDDDLTVLVLRRLS